eukprot:CAMPEP_0181337704 /NCGR_PEP_ID=MMETSP1101-20121128/28179_1 /TAXON_ID=46948 /ORGANISM="Rhodomonas abbreviata, Strain Caron Lab Isolate" /LENGTH=84 /DNA_ID=CAMNT_0023448253 /DNA_START=163 /DNA_END=414 /DNA_ORIENTATION=-
MESGKASGGQKYRQPAHAVANSSELPADMKQRENIQQLPPSAPSMAGAQSWMFGPTRWSADPVGPPGVGVAPPTLAGGMGPGSI